VERHLRNVVYDKGHNLALEAIFQLEISLEKKRVLQAAVEEATYLLATHKK